MRRGRQIQRLLSHASIQIAIELLKKTQKVQQQIHLPLQVQQMNLLPLHTRDVLLKPLLRQ